MPGSGSETASSSPAGGRASCGRTDLAGAPPAPSFQQSLAASARLVRSTSEGPEAHELPTALLRGVSALHLAGILLDVDYKAVHESDHTGWLRLSFITEGLYQQLHATVAMAVMLADRRTANQIGSTSIATYLDELDRSPAHPLSVEVAAARRDLDLLRWLCAVRNKAIRTAPNTATPAAAPW